jgi:hypothetical protein
MTAQIIQFKPRKKDMGPSTEDLAVLCLQIGLMLNPWYWPLLMMEDKR